MSKLIVSPQAGFGNRLRALCAGILFGLLTDREVYHFWVRDEGSSYHPNVGDMKTFDPNSLFDLRLPLFQDEAVDLCFSEWLPGDHWHGEQSTAQSRLRCGRLERLQRFDNFHEPSALLDACGDVILLETSLEVHVPRCLQFRDVLMTETYRRYFPLQPRWQRFLQQVPTFDLGFSIRRGAFLNFFPDAEMTVEYLASIIDGLPGSKIIFSDDEEFAAKLRRSVGSALCIGKDVSGFPGVEGYIAQFLILSECRQVYGTRDSSFAEQAALFGGRPFRPYEPQPA